SCAMAAGAAAMVLSVKASKASFFIVLPFSWVRIVRTTTSHMEAHLDYRNARLQPVAELSCPGYWLDRVRVRIQRTCGRTAWRPRDQECQGSRGRRGYQDL